MATARFDVQRVLPPQFTDLFSLPASLGIQSAGEPQPQSPSFIQGLVSEPPPVTPSSCSYDFFKWKLFIRLPPPVRDCVKLHGLICASMIRARREICAPRRFPRRFTISRLPFPRLRVVVALCRSVAAVPLLPFRCRSRFPLDSFVCSTRTDLPAKKSSRLIKPASSDRLTVL